jgi:hypothetical protein
MEIGAVEVAGLLLLWIAQLLVACCLVSLLFLAFAIWRARRRDRVLRAALNDPDHSVLRFPPYQGL